VVTGFDDGYFTEDAVAKTAQQLKSFNSNVKVLMYWGVDMQSTVNCYSKPTHQKYFHTSGALLFVNNSL
jgi:hypothetical protein